MPTSEMPSAHVYGPEIILRFAPVHDVVSFLQDATHAGKRGVYLYGFRFPDQATGQLGPLLPYYVGKHEIDIQVRVGKHVDGIRTGTHRILERHILLAPDCRRHFHYRTSKSEHCNYAYLHSRNQTSKSALPEPQKAALQPHIKAYTDNLFVTYLATNSLDLSDETGFVRLLERYVQHRIGDGTKYLISRLGARFPAGFSPTIKAGPGTEHLLCSQVVAVPARPTNTHEASLRRPVSCEFAAPMSARLRRWSPFRSKSTAPADSPGWDLECRMGDGGQAERPGAGRVVGLSLDLTV